MISRPCIIYPAAFIYFTGWHTVGYFVLLQEMLVLVLPNELGGAAVVSSDSDFRASAFPSVSQLSLRRLSDNEQVCAIDPPRPSSGDEVSLLPVDVTLSTWLTGSDAGSAATSVSVSSVWFSCCFVASVVGVVALELSSRRVSGCEQSSESILSNTSLLRLDSCEKLN